MTKTNQVLLGYGGVTGTTLTVYKNLGVRTDMIKTLDGLDALAVEAIESFEHIRPHGFSPEGEMVGYRHGGGFTSLHSTTQEEIEKLRAANNKAKVEKKEKKRQERIESLKRTIAKGENQKNIMTEAEYTVWKKTYNDVMNEGGEGYIPNLITVEQLAMAKKALAELEGK